MSAFNGYQQSKDFCFFRKHPTLLGPFFTNGHRLVIKNGKEENKSRYALYISYY